MTPRRLTGSISTRSLSADEQFARLVDEMLSRSEATYGNDASGAHGARRSFGSTSLKANGKIFAMLVKERMVVKLPEERVNALISQGVGSRFDNGRPQREWLSVSSEAYDEWLALASESEQFVSGR
jgi:hypothetical protein